MRGPRGRDRCCCAWSRVGRSLECILRIGLEGEGLADVGED